MTKFTVDFKLHCFIPVEVEAETLEEAEQKAEAIAMKSGTISTRFGTAGASLTVMSGSTSLSSCRR